MQFKDVIGQQEIQMNLVRMINLNRLSHALLFLGKEGCGSLSLALAFAQYIVCEKQSGIGSQLLMKESSTTINTSPTDSCGECAACIKASQLIHPDIHFSYPVIPKKSGDKPVAPIIAANCARL